jgi:hypothetical protein
MCIYKCKPVFGMALSLAITIMSIFLPIQYCFGAESIWDLGLNKETHEISRSDFKSWMAKKGFESFKFMFFKREPKYWRLAHCPGSGNICLEMEDLKTSSHILQKLKHPIPLSDNLYLVMEFMVEEWPEHTDLSKKDKEDAALRVFLTADVDGKKATLGLAVTRDHKSGQIMASEREPEKIKYLALPADTTHEKIWQRLSTPITASFKKAFGSYQKGEILVLGLKSDGNNTESDVKVWLKDLKIQKQ